MQTYQIFGLRLRSEFPFPELTPAPSESASLAGGTWALVRSPVSPPPDSPLESLGRDDVQPEVEVHLSRLDQRYRLRYDDTGLFEVDPTEQRITWYPPPDPVSMETVRKDVTSRVLALVLHASGIPTLHGSAVDLDGGCLAFVGPKGHGKSTTAAALSRAGAHLLADDTIGIRLTDPPTVVAGVPGVQLWRDAVDRLDLANGATSQETIPKVWVGRPEPGGIPAAAAPPVPLRAVYLMSPSGESEAPLRERIEGPQAALALLGQTKIGMMLGVEAMTLLLPRLNTVLEHAPLYRLRIPRGLDRLGEVVEALKGWHGVAAAGERSGS